MLLIYMPKNGENGQRHDTYILPQLNILKNNWETQKGNVCLIRAHTRSGAKHSVTPDLPKRAHPPGKPASEPFPKCIFTPEICISQAPLANCPLAHQQMFNCPRGEGAGDATGKVSEPEF